MQKNKWTQSSSARQLEGTCGFVRSSYCSRTFAIPAHFLRTTDFGASFQKCEPSLFLSNGGNPDWGGWWKRETIDYTYKYPIINFSISATLKWCHWSGGIKLFCCKAAKSTGTKTTGQKKTVVNRGRREECVPDRLQNEYHGSHGAQQGEASYTHTQLSDRSGSCRSRE